MRPPFLLFLSLLLLDTPARAATPASRLVDFNRDIRPILSDNCYHCHGPDEKTRKAKLRLDLKEGAYKDLGGYQAIKPNNVAASEVWKRINSKDPEEKMPPPETGRKLKPEQIVLLKQWIEQGGTYQGHWAFVPPVHPEPPKIKISKWADNGIDYFIAAKLEAKGLSPSREANRETLIRRVTFDLTGLPPTPADVDAFLADKAPGAYERVVERLLNSPRYGEHQARYWLDVARYGDTHGLHLDNERSMWPYRDWVVNAFNRNLPFDQFTVEQLAGDLLPAPTQDQLVASGFNRCNVSTSEGGAIPEEFQVRYTVDRVETMSQVWLGLTAGCAVCHDHKFDPISQREFYQLFSFFNNATESAMDGNALLPPPTMKLPTAGQKKQLEEFDRRIAALEKQIKAEVAKVHYSEPEGLTNEPAAKPREVVWVEDDFPAGAKTSINAGTAPLTWIENDQRVFSGKRSLRRTDKGLAQDIFTGVDLPLEVAAGDEFFAYVYLDPNDPPKAIMLQFHTTGWLHRANWGDLDAIEYGTKGTTQKVQAGPLPPPRKWTRLEIPAAKLGLMPGEKITGMAFTQFGGTVYWDKAGCVTTGGKDESARSLLAWETKMKGNPGKASLPKPVQDALKIDPAKRNDAQRQTVEEYYVENILEETRPVFEPLQRQLTLVKGQRDDLDKKIPATMVMAEMEKPRGAFILKRGQYDQKGEPVQPGTPAILPPLAKSNTTNRLDLARWMVSPQHPLTARVTVNRFWQQFFGAGLVKTAGDFGAQGEFPSHPELLDWLATEFMASGWDIKNFHKLIVTSATYRQDSRVAKKSLETDPENRLLSHGPRFRLDAEVLRDNALFVSGLLNDKMGGRGVRPYQPPGIWEAVAYTTSNTAKYIQDNGDALYRRSLYIFWKRTAPPPSMTTFDAPSREACTVRRERTNTPLQALLLMNDPQYFEAARNLAARILTQGGPGIADRLSFGFRLVTSRFPTTKEQAVLQQTLAAHLARYSADGEAAKKLLGVGESKVRPGLDESELAAYTMVANLLLNLDEVVTKN